MEKLKELMKNKRFMLIFSGFIALIGIIIIIKNKGNKTPAAPEIDRDEELRNKLKQANKTLKEIKKKNDELEKKANGKSITANNSNGKPKPTKPAGNEEEGQTSGDDEGQDDDTDDSAE